MPPSSSSPPPDNERSPQPSSRLDAPEDIDFEQSLREVEQSLLTLKARHAQVQLDQQRQQELQQRQEAIEKRLQYDRANSVQAELKQELKRIRQQLDEIEVALESQLFSWNGMKEVFWQAVRFGGLGIVIGWILKSWIG